MLKANLYAIYSVTSLVAFLFNEAKLGLAFQAA